MKRTRRWILLASVVAALGTTWLWGLSAAPAGPSGNANRGFNLASLNGSYASSGQAGTSRSVGVVVYDGRGNLARTVRINASDGNGGRRLIDLTSIGTYTVNSDGTGVMNLTNFVGSNTTNVTFDFVIGKSSPGGYRGALQSLEITTIQREPGMTASLVEDFLTYREGL